MRILLLLLIIHISLVSRGQDIDLYAVAHPDDWQLFMSPNIFNSLRDQQKVVLITTTAGDAGAGIGDDSYYQAREEGSNRAIRFMMNALDPDMRGGSDMNEKLVVVNGHYMVRCEYGKLVAYYLRLPDGNYDGSGYTIHKEHSLKKFYEGEVPSLRSIDRQTAFTSLDDLTITLHKLILSEASGDGIIRFNLADTDEQQNPDDHSDHRYTSMLFQDVARAMRVDSVRVYQEYSTNRNPINVNGYNFLISVGIWAATTSGLSDSNHYSTWDDLHNSWLGRQYFRNLSITE